jgi:hypothetical protein
LNQHIKPQYRYVVLREGTPTRIIGSRSIS